MWRKVNLALPRHMTTTPQPFFIVKFRRCSLLQYHPFFSKGQSLYAFDYKRERGRNCV